jgi:hypothetical protein
LRALRLLIASLQQMNSAAKETQGEMKRMRVLTFAAALVTANALSA